MYQIFIISVFLEIKEFEYLNISFNFNPKCPISKSYECQIACYR